MDPPMTTKGAKRGFVLFFDPNPRHTQGLNAGTCLAKSAVQALLQRIALGRELFDLGLQGLLTPSRAGNRRGTMSWL